MRGSVLRSILPIVLAVAAASVLPLDRATAQTSSPAAMRSTLDSVFTAEQATKGREVYANNCEGCHTPDSHSGADFRKSWAGRAVIELFAYLRAEMPKSEPGILAESEYVNVTAYLLRMNGMPAGSVEFPADTGAMRLIRFDTTGAAKTDNLASARSRPFRR